jgi:hypothetical protein
MPRRRLQCRKRRERLTGPAAAILQDSLRSLTRPLRALLTFAAVERFGVRSQTRLQELVVLVLVVKAVPLSRRPHPRDRQQPVSQIETPLRRGRHIPDEHTPNFGPHGCLPQFVLADPPDRRYQPVEALGRQPLQRRQIGLEPVPLDGDLDVTPRKPASGPHALAGEGRRCVVGSVAVPADP